MKTATTIKHATQPSLTFGDLNSGAMFLHRQNENAVYVKMIPPTGSRANCVLLTGSGAGAYGQCLDTDSVQLVKQADFIV